MTTVNLIPGKLYRISPRLDRTVTGFYTGTFIEGMPQADIVVFRIPTTKWAWSKPFLFLVQINDHKGKVDREGMASLNLRQFVFLCGGTMICTDYNPPSSTWPGEYFQEVGKENKSEDPGCHDEHDYDERPGL